MKHGRLINPEYVAHLERKLFKIKTIIELAESWSKDQDNGLTDSSICISAMKDIRKVIKDDNR